MTALTANVNRGHRDGNLTLRFPVTDAVQVYAGGYYGIDHATGTVKLFTDAANQSPLGMAKEKVLGTASNPLCEFEAGSFVLPNIDVTGVSAIADVGDPVYITPSDDNLLTKTAPSTAKVIPFGHITRWYSGTKCDVMVTSISMKLYGFQAV